MNTTTPNQPKITPKEKFQVKWPLFVGLILVNVYLYNKYGINSVLLLDGILLLLLGFLRAFFFTLHKTL